MAKPFAIITGASTGIGYELAILAAQNGYDLLVAADETLIENSAKDFEKHGAEVLSVQADLSTIDGVDTLLEAAGGRSIDLLCANAGRGLGHGFLDQPVDQWRKVVDTNITGTLYLLQRTLKQMVARGTTGEGKVLITGSIAGFMPGSFQAVYNGSKAFIDSFADAIRNELKDKDGITITTLMPGPTETEFFHRAKMGDTSVGSSEKADPAKVAKDGWNALMAGKGNIVSGLKNKLEAAAAHVLPASVLAERHRQMAEPGSGQS